MRLAKPYSIRLADYVQEGLYGISRQVYDARLTDVSLSSKAIITAWIVLNNFPIVNAPLAAEKHTTHAPQSVRFNWHPEGALPSGGFTNEYSLELYEVRQEGCNPNAIVRGSQLVATITTTGTSLFLMLRNRDGFNQEGTDKEGYNRKDYDR